MNRNDILRLCDISEKSVGADRAEMHQIIASIRDSLKDSFPITSVSRDDFKDMAGYKSYDPSSLTDEDMEQLANTLQDALVGDAYWDTLQEFAEEKGLPKTSEDEEEEEDEE